MARRVLAFLETFSAGQEHRQRERSMLQATAWLVERCGFTADLVLWGETRISRLPAPLANCRVHHLEDMPPSSLMSTVDMAACATGFIRSFRPDAVLVSSSQINSNIHLLAAAFAFLQPAEFFFGVTEFEAAADGRFVCRRPASGCLFETNPEFPVVLGITHCAGFSPYPSVAAPEAAVLPLSELGLELELIQMRSALFPEPVSIIHPTDSRLTDLQTAVSWLTADEDTD
ncbi:hypothetical protein KKD52_13260 [Myxococcota bacterium]|nr:hypothetical protein [Myxococcota bacterium]MBU1412960.1 hypothetical protein [Myxococcota bacterium]MBU1511323.1 hypothetical protein [Myxococcota bacterium]